MDKPIKIGKKNMWYYFNENRISLKLTENIKSANMMAIPSRLKYSKLILDFFGLSTSVKEKYYISFINEKQKEYELYIKIETANKTSRTVDEYRLSWGKDFKKYISTFDPIKHREAIIRAKKMGYDNPLFYLDIRKKRQGEYFITRKIKSDEFWYSDDNNWSFDEYKKYLKKTVVNGNTDLEITTTIRMEQNFLRNELLGSAKEVKCGICKKEYPVEFIWCSHIKKRSECTYEERIDIEHIAMPMCKFGCDDLYENGFITVLNGIIKRGKPINNKNIKEKISLLIGNKIHKDYYNKKSAKYFQWHFNRYNKS
jgi:hypothetical protein|tara:strand:+ start:1374 stop:2309 length:936 start_codon:yes stop_codon:yes gene_type:complete